MISENKGKKQGMALKKLYKLYFSEAKLLSQAFALLILEAAATVLSSRALAGALKAVALDMPAISYALALTGAYILSSLFDLGHRLIMNAASQRIERNIRGSLLGKLDGRALPFADDYNKGDLMSRVANDTVLASQAIAQSTCLLALDSFKLIYFPIMMISINARLALAMLICAPLALFATARVSSIARRQYEDRQGAMGKLASLVEETIAANRDIKAYGMEKKLAERFRLANEGYCIAAGRAQALSGFAMPISMAFANLGYLCAAALGGSLVANGGIAPATLAAFIVYASMFTLPINNIAETINSLQASLAGAGRASELLEMPGEGESKAHMESPKGAIRFESASFAYSEGIEALKNASFEIGPGQKAAFVGDLGSGKSTAASLLCGLISCQSGAVYIDGADIQTILKSDLGKAFNVAFQDPYIFTGAVSENIRFGRPEASDEDVYEAAKAVGAYEFISRLKDGFSTVVGQGHLQLSQGQLQLLSLARAALRRAPIFILDEPAGSFGIKPADGIYEALLDLNKGSTCVLITNNLLAARAADVIFVFKGGEIVEKGSHSELAGLKGVYYSMLESQL